jgi:hypothetical protein
MDSMNYLTILQYYEMDETESKRIESEYKLLTGETVVSHLNAYFSTYKVKEDSFYENS